MAIPIPTTPRRMSAVDAGFLYLDRPHAPLQIASLVLLSGAISIDELAGRIEARIARAPRLAQRARRVPLALGHPTWEDAPDFNARDHMLQWALPGAAGEFELHELAARLLAQPMLWDRPLWAMHLLDGLYDGRSALLIKLHHCMADGLSGVQLLEAILDFVPGDADRRCTGALRRQLRAGAAAWNLLEAGRCAVELASRGIRQMPWNGRVGARRQLHFTRLPLETVARVRRAHGATLNDVVLSVLAGGLRRYLDAIGVRTRGVDLVGLVPVSVRAHDELAVPCNRISAILVPLALGLEDERERLRATCALTRRLKEERAWSGIEALLGLLDLLPPALVASCARGLRNLAIANVVATSVPGPREERFLCSRRVEAIYPIVPIADGLGLGFAALSYQGALHVGLNTDPALVPDLEKIGHAIDAAFRDLCASG